MYLKKIEEGLVTETLAKNPQIAGIDRVEVMNETLAVLERGSYVSPMGVVHQLKRDAMIKAAKSVKVYQSGGEDAQRMGSKPTQIIVKNLDCLYAAKEFYDLGYNPIVLNMANPKHPGGGYRKGARAQEEDLFRRTDLSYLLDTECNVQEVNFYPLNKKSESVGLYVPKTVVFRAGKDKRYAFLNKSYEVAVAVIAALLNPPTRTVNGKPRLSNTNAEITFEKVCTVLEMAFEEGHQVVILGAFGCGAFRNPPDHVSEIFMDTILKRYAHCFECIVFAITEDSNSRENNDEGNFIPFARRAIKAGGKAFNAQGQEVTFKQ